MSRVGCLTSVTDASQARRHVITPTTATGVHCPSGRPGLRSGQELVSSGGMRSMDSRQVVRPAPAQLRPATAAPSWSVRLVDGFALSCDGRLVRLPISAQRLVAFL